MSQRKSSLARQRESELLRLRRRLSFTNRELIKTFVGHVPRQFRSSIFPHWESDDAVTLRQIVEWADDELDWLLARARCDKDMVLRLAYGVVGVNEVSVDWWNEMAASLNDAVGALFAQRKDAYESAKSLTNYWTDMQKRPGEVPSNGNITRLFPREVQS